MTGLLLVMGVSMAYSQGVTTSSLSGKVINEQGVPVLAASVVAVHTPSGFQYGTITNEDGRYNIRNMRVGGPYRVEVSYVGYQNSTETDVFLVLNKTGEVDFTLSEAVQQLEEVVVAYNRNDVINSDRTGAMTSISREHQDHAGVGWKQFRRKEQPLQQFLPRRIDF